MCAFLHAEYGAPEEGELKGRQPLTLKNQLLSKWPEMAKILPAALKIFYGLSFSGVYMENKRFKSLEGVMALQLIILLLHTVAVSRYLLLCCSFPPLTQLRLNGE